LFVTQNEIYIYIDIYIYAIYIYRFLFIHPTLVVDRSGPGLSSNPPGGFVLGASTPIGAVKERFDDMLGEVWP